MEGEKQVQDSPTVVQLRNSRAGHVSRLTKLYRAIEALQENEDAVGVSERLVDVDEAFRRFEKAADDYYNALTGKVEDQNEAEKYYNEQRYRYLDFHFKTRKWLDEMAVNDGITPEDSASSVGSRTGQNSNVSVTSSMAAKKVKVKQALARLKLQQLKCKQDFLRQEEEMKLKRQILDAQCQIEQADLQAQIFQDEEEEEREGLSEKPYFRSKPTSVIGKVEPIELGLDPNAPPFQYSTKREQINDHEDTSSLSSGAAGEKVLEKLASTIRQGFALPKPDLPTFDGDPLEYWSFIRSFENNIERNLTDESEKLMYLLQYTTGEARKTIKCCAVMDPLQGYQTARKILKERFGHPYTIASKYVTKLTNGPVLKTNDRAGLLKFSDELKDCQNILESVGYLDEINSADNLRRVVQRLPYHLRMKFIDTADAIHQSGQRLNIRHIAEFVKTKARAVNDPVFGSIIDSMHESKPSTGSRIKPKSSAVTQPQLRATTLTTQGSLKRVPSVISRELYSATKRNACQACGESHSLRGCQKFSKMSFEERAKIMRTSNLCNNCFRPGHIALGCLEKRACEVEGCTRRHHTLLHPPDRAETKVDQANKVESVKPEVTSQDKTPENKQSNSMSMKGGRICLRVVPVRVQGLQKSVTTYALLDTGSDVSLCSKELASQVGVKGEPRTFFLTTQEKRDSPRTGQETSLTVYSLDGADKIEIGKLWTVDKINVSSYNIPTSEDLKKWPHLSDVKLLNIGAKKIEMIIGADVPEAFWVLEERRGNQGDPYAIRSPLGWTLLGPTDKVNCNDRRYSTNFIRLKESQEADDHLLQQVKQFWKNDYKGTVSDSKTTMSLEDKQALTTMEATAALVEGRYQIGLPWKQEIPYLPNNRSLAEQRLKMLKKRLLNDEKLFDKYSATVQDYIDKGHARQVPSSEVEVKGKPLWYLPHHPVFNPNKPKKTRVVFDCAAKFKGTSLNDQLLSGPDLTSSIVGVLTRFRQETVALAADIECMFHQVKVSPSDYDAFRFLWWPNNDLNREAVDHRMEVHLFGATSSPACASYALQKAAEDNKDCFPENVVKTVKRNFYVDDYLKSVQSTGEACQLVNQLTQLLFKGGFRLTKWLCNVPEVIESIPETERASTILDLDLDKGRLPVERTLGLKWDMQTDEFTFDVKEKEKPKTRRGILSITSSVYDPLGFLAPIVLPAKRLLQDLCKSQIGWDDPIGEKESQQWERWKSQLPKLAQLTVKRCVKPISFGKIKSVGIHNFADASQFAYGTVSYLRVVNEEDNVHCSFLMGKSRLAHIRPMTVPRLELSAAVLAVNIDKLLKQELEINLETSTFWTDSTSVLQYIRNTSRRFHTFVANRLSIIHENTEPHQWRYVSTDLNPADDASRGLTAEQMCKENRWIIGPEFLRKNEYDWPAEPTRVKLEDVPENDPEVKGNQCYSQITSEFGADKIYEMINRYSSWNKLKRAIAWLLKFKHWLVNKDRSTEVKLKVEDVQAAEMVIIKYIQKSSFSEVINQLKDTKPADTGRRTRAKLKHLKSSTSLLKLNPLVDDEGILRVGGRLENAPLGYEAKHQIILPSDCHVTSLIIRQCHQDVGHLGEAYVLSNLRDTYWVIKGKSTVRKVIGTCLVCKRLNAVRGEQQMANLPQERLIPDDPPFTYIGIDYFGPLYVRQRRAHVKRYGCLFTCLTTRAVHIEVAESLDTDSFVNALRRFMNLRGKPKVVYSDNGTNFCAGEKELRESLQVWNQAHIDKFLVQENIAWHFNPPAASHMGGIWERVIRTIRKILKALLGEQLVSDEMLRTFLTEVQAILNSRPLTSISDDPKDQHPLTPNHLLLLKSNPNLSPGIFEKEDNYCKRRWRQVQYLVEIFWKRWMKEYIPILQERQKWLIPKRSLTEGDLVLVVDESMPRSKWPLGRVVQAFRGRDGLVRSAKIFTRSSYITRPITKLCFLEHDA